MKANVLCMIIGALFALQACVTNSGIDAIRVAPVVEASEYNCDGMVIAVNTLRSLGKSKAIEAMKGYVALPSERGTHKVLLLCRLLFVNTNGGWNDFPLGQPRPDIDTKAANNFPMFPIAMVDGTPFLIVESYSLAGAIDLKGCLDRCEKLEMISKDLVRRDYRAAARSLINSKEWRKVYINQEDQDRMAIYIENQAELILQKRKR